MVLEDNLEANEWHGDLDRELFRRSVRDGEFLLACYPAGDEYTHLRVVEPEQVRDQGNAHPIDDAVLAAHGVYPTAATNWRFGVHKYDHDAQHILGYLVQWHDGEDYLPSGLVVHAKRNVDRSAARGISDFWPAWRWLQKQEKLLRRTVNGASLQASIAWLVKHAQGVVQSQVTNLRRDNASYTTQRRTAGGTVQNVDGAGLRRGRHGGGPRPRD